MPPIALSVVAIYRVIGSFYAIRSSMCYPFRFTLINVLKNAKEDISEFEYTDALDRTGYVHIAFSAGNKEKVDELTEKARLAGYEVISGPRTTGDGYYESCILAIENNQIEITV